MSNIKQVIVVRTKYPDGKGGTFKPRTGKLMAQVAHASMKVFFDKTALINRSVWDYIAMFSVNPDEKEWIEGAFTKVVVSVNSEKELLEIYKKAQEAQLLCSLVTDNGLTEFHGNKTNTVVAIGPAKSEEIDKITKDLPLL